MDYKQAANGIIKNIGGKENVEHLSHCATRLRFNLKNDDLVDVEELKSIKGVISTANRGGQFQIIIGAEVVEVYNEINNQFAGVVTAVADSSTSIQDSQNAQTEKKKNVITRVLDSVAGIFVSIIPVLIAAGMTSSILALLTTFHWVSTDSSTYLILSSIQQAIFNFLPLFVGHATAVKLKTNPSLGMGLGAVLCFASINATEGLNFLGIPVRAITYTSSVFPVLLGVWALSYIERFFSKYVPKMLRGILVPMLCMIIIVPLTLIVFGPIGATLGDALASLITALNTHVGWLSPVIIAGLYPFMILTGMHYSLLPIAMASFAGIGYDPLLMVAGFLSNMCEAAVSLAVAVKTKQKDLKSLAYSTSFSALMGITEPALFGVTLRFKKSLLAVSIGGASGALYAGLMSVKAYGFVGGLPSLPLFLSPGGGWANLINLVIAVLISFVVTFILTYTFAYQESKEAQHA